MTDPLTYVIAWLGNGPAPQRALPEDQVNALLRRAEAEGVGGIVAGHFPGQGDRVLSWFGGTAQHLALLDRLAQPLAEQGLQVIALKGAALAPTVYEGQLSCRPMSDLDLLVRPADEQSVRDLVAGLAAQSQAQIYVDWHSNLIDDHRIPRKARLLRLTHDELWLLSRPWQGGIRHLTPELQFIHLALHAFKHSCCRLIWLVDLALVVRACRQEELLELARRTGALRPVLVALHLLAQLLGEQLAETGSLRLYERWALRLACRRSKLAWGELFLALSVEGLANKLVYLWQYLFPGPAVLGEEGRLKATVRRARRFLTNPGRTLG